MIVCLMLHVQLCFGHGELGKRVLFILVYHIEKLWARLNVVFYGLNRFFHPQITRAYKNNPSPINRKRPIERFD